MAKAKEDPYTWATGRRKTAIARVRLKPGTGKVLVNNRDLKEYFPSVEETQRVVAPLVSVGVEKTFVPGEPERSFELFAGGLDQLVGREGAGRSTVAATVSIVRIWT